MPIISPAANDLAKRAAEYSEENPLYVIASGAITNIAFAILINPEVTKNIVVIWLGGHARHYYDTNEFNMRQDFAAARVVMSSGVPFVQLPCMGVVSSFTISKPELDYWLKGKNKLSDYLAETTINEANGYAKGKPWTRAIWDVTAVAWLLNDNDCFMQSRIIHVKLPTNDGHYFDASAKKLQRYVYYIHRDNLMEDLINKIVNFSL